ncbi:MAG: hypothetical protein V3V16_08615 [Melioribacteraceae bacterium]
MLTNKDKKEILKKILETKEFKSSRNSKKLLSYLVESSINNVKLKEYTLAIDVFEKSSNFNSAEDSSVRVYVSNLRKKLDHYYASVGRNDKYKIEIPKGHYDLGFVSNIISKPKTTSPNWKWLSLILLPLLFLLLAYTLFNKFSLSSADMKISSEILSHKVWQNLDKKDFPKMLALGNDLFYLVNLGDDETITRKHEINTVGMFRHNKKTNPDIAISEITPYPFFPLINVSVLPKISISLLSDGKFQFKNSMEVNGNDLKENNVVFIGSFRNLHSMSFLLEDDIYEFGNYLNNTFLNIQEHDSIRVFKQSGEMDGEHVDFCLFRKIPGPNNNTIYMFISFFEPAMETAVNYLLNEKSLDELTNMMKKKYGEFPQYFDVLFKSSGFKRTAYTSNIEFIRKIDPDSLNIW